MYKIYSYKVEKINYYILVGLPYKHRLIVSSIIPFPLAGLAMSLSRRKHSRPVPLTRASQACAPDRWLSKYFRVNGLLINADAYIFIYKHS